MVTQAQLNEGLEKLRTDLTTIINESILSVKDALILNLTEANKNMSAKIQALEDKVVNLETQLQANLQYNRQNNILISGIPAEVEHEALENISIGIINKCCSGVVVSADDVQGCHRLSPKNPDVVCRVVNKKYVEKTLANRIKINNLSDDDKTLLGLPTRTDEIFLNEHLSPFNAKLAFYCRRLKKNNFINRMSTKKGIVKIEGYFGSAVFSWKTIGHFNDLQNLFEDLEAKIVIA